MVNLEELSNTELCLYDLPSWSYSSLKFPIRGNKWVSATFQEGIHCLSQVVVIFYLFVFLDKTWATPRFQVP